MSGNPPRKDTNYISHVKQFPPSTQTPSMGDRIASLPHINESQARNLEKIIDKLIEDPALADHVAYHMRQTLREWEYKRTPTKQSNAQATLELTLIRYNLLNQPAAYANPNLPPVARGSKEYVDRLLCLFQHPTPKYTILHPRALVDTEEGPLE